LAHVLLTGGAGYIGSHTAVALSERGHDVIILDNFSNSERDVPERLLRLTGHAYRIMEVDIRDTVALGGALAAFPVDAVIHFAALKAVGESEADPLLYYDMNIVGTIRLLEAMQLRNIRRIVFSSSATVYGQPDTSPILENFPTRVQNIYGRTKLVMETLINDLARTGVPNNLMPYICQVATGEREFLQVFGNDYNTPDGTGVRDYIHVVDLAKAHVLALEHIMENAGALTVNLGTGTGISVLEMVHAFERATRREIPYKVVPRRPGDVDSYYADPGAAEKLFGWKATLTLDDMCRDAWRWQAKRAGINDV
jgi:UDP-glucose 4-epimerase